MSFLSDISKNLRKTQSTESAEHSASSKKNVHQEELTAYFKDLKLPADAQPLGGPVCIMLFTNRSGSNVLGEYLRATHQFSGFVEALNYRRVIKYSQQNDLRSFFDYLTWQVLRLSEGDKVVGIKASVDQAEMLHQCNAIPCYFDNVHWVVVQRGDTLAQAISFSIAAQTRQWTSSDAAASADPVYNYEDIRRRVEMLCDEQARLNAFCAMRGISPIRATYEEFTADSKGSVRGIAGQMGIDSLVFDESILTLRPQSAGRNEEFRARFIEDYSARN